MTEHFQKIGTEIERIFPHDEMWLVGGAVRDSLQGIPSEDYDFATSMLPVAIEDAIQKAGRKPYLMGKRFGTIGVTVEGQMVEITTFRTEEYQSGNRSPDLRFAATIEADLSHRDFTVNAMAFDRDGSLFDPFGGKEDIDNKLLRTVGKPNERFKEDPLRILRLSRFAAQLGFGIEERTMDIAKQLSYKLLEVSRERWTMEMDKLLVAEYVTRGLQILAQTDALKHILPEVGLQVDFNQDSPYHTLDLWQHTMAVVAGVNASLELRWAALLHDVGKPFVARLNSKGYTNYLRHDIVGAEIADKIGWHLRWSNERRETVVSLIRDHLRDDSPLKEADQVAK